MHTKIKESVLKDYSDDYDSFSNESIAFQNASTSTSIGSNSGTALNLHKIATLIFDVVKDVQKEDTPPDKVFTAFFFCLIVLLAFIVLYSALAMHFDNIQNRDRERDNHRNIIRLRQRMRMYMYNDPTVADANNVNNLSVPEP